MLPGLWQCILILVFRPGVVVYLWLPEKSVLYALSYSIFQDEMGIHSRVSISGFIFPFVMHSSRGCCISGRCISLKRCTLAPEKEWTFCMAAGYLVVWYFSRDCSGYQCFCLCFKWRMKLAPQNIYSFLSFSVKVLPLLSSEWLTKSYWALCKQLKFSRNDQTKFCSSYKLFLWLWCLNPVWTRCLWLLGLHLGDSNISVVFMRCLTRDPWTQLSTKPQDLFCAFPVHRRNEQDSSSLVWLGRGKSLLLVWQKAVSTHKS